jgi:dTDP-4-dehydrorhamnose 3,5-epimerase-like enzyme
MSAFPRLGVIGRHRFKHLHNELGGLTVVELAREIAFPVVRVFFVTAAKIGTLRGCHAHRRGNQFQICVGGRVEAIFFDGEGRQSLVLGRGEGVLLPAGIWGEQRYLEADSALLVLCDQPYAAEDYIEDRDAYIRMATSSRTG